MFKKIFLAALLVQQGCSQHQVPGNYSLYFVRTFNHFWEPSENYIKEHANVILHINSHKLDRDFERLADLASEGREIDEFEAHALLVRHSDGAKYRLGISEDCGYLVIFNDDSVACDKELYVSIFMQFQSPLTESY